MKLRNFAAKQNKHKGGLHQAGNPDYENARDRKKWRKEMKKLRRLRQSKHDIWDV